MTGKESCQGPERRPGPEPPQFAVTATGYELLEHSKLVTESHSVLEAGPSKPSVVTTVGLVDELWRIVGYLLCCRILDPDILLGMKATFFHLGNSTRAWGKR